MLRIPDSLRHRLLAWAMDNHVRARPADFEVEQDGQPYMHRWFVVRDGVRWLSLPAAERARILAEQDAREDNPDNDKRLRGSRNVYIHQFWGSDRETVHCHPWRWATLLLDGWYMEHLPVARNWQSGPCRQVIRRAGDVVLRPSAARAHRIEICRAPVTTLFLTGARLRDWGFWTKDGWVHWRRFVARGCE